MTTKNETYFGNPDTFAIRYLQILSDENEGEKYAYCHLVLGGQIIGDKNEKCYLKTWMSAIYSLKEKLDNNFEALSIPEFKNKTDREIFELLLKANQLETEHKQDFSYLLILDNEVWSSCLISLDETIDAYMIFMIESDRKIQLLWCDWREQCQVDKIDKLYSITVDKKFMTNTIESFLLTINKQIHSKS